MFSFEVRLLVISLIVISFTAASKLSVPVWQDASALVSGKVTEETEDDFDEAFPLRQFAVNFWTAVSYIGFREGEPGITIGKYGWLYSQEEFIADKDALGTYEKNLAFVRDVSKKLSAKGVDLVIVPVPTKTRIYPEYVAGDQQNEVFEGLYQRFLNDLNASDIAAVDSRSVLAQGKAGQQMFLRTDTHWTPQGAALVAQAVADVVGPQGTTQYLRRNQVPVTHEGDLMNFLPLAPWFKELSPPLDTVDQWVFESSLTEDDLFAEPTIPTVALVGTSFSNNKRWHFSDSLRQQLRSDLVDYSRSGEGPFKPMNSMLTEHGKNLPEQGVVLWEIPERYLINSNFVST